MRLSRSSVRRWGRKPRYARIGGFETVVPCARARSDDEGQLTMHFQTALQGQ